MKPYRDKLESWFRSGEESPVQISDSGLFAGGLHCSLPLTGEEDVGVPGLGAHFFEFVPVNVVQAAPEDPTQWTLLTLDEVSEGGQRGE